MSTPNEEDAKKATIRQLNEVKAMYREAVRNHTTLDVLVKSLTLDSQRGALAATDVADQVHASIAESIESHDELIGDIIGEVESDQLSVHAAGSEVMEEMLKIAKMGEAVNQMLLTLLDFGATLTADELCVIGQNIQLKGLIQELAPGFFATLDQQNNTSAN